MRVELWESTPHNCRPHCCAWKEGESRRRVGEVAKDKQGRHTEQLSFAITNTRDNQLTKKKDILDHSFSSLSWWLRASRGFLYSKSAPDNREYSDVPQSLTRPSKERRRQREKRGGEKGRGEARQEKGSGLRLLISLGHNSPWPSHFPLGLKIKAPSAYCKQLIENQAFNT